VTNRGVLNRYGTLVSKGCGDETIHFSAKGSICSACNKQKMAQKSVSSLFMG